MSIIDSVATSYVETLNRHQALFETMEAYHQESMQLLEACHSALQAGGKIVWFGNGGSAADAQHLAAEFVVRYKLERGPLASMALTTDTSILTAHSNDYHFDTVFERQVQALCKPED